MENEDLVLLLMGTAVGFGLGYFARAMAEKEMAGKAQTWGNLPLAFVPSEPANAPVMPYTPPAQAPPIPPVPSGPGPMTAPFLLTADPIPVVPGRTYHAIVSVGFPVSVLASTESVRKQAQKLGFSNVKVTSTRPANFPSRTEGDYYIEGTWGAGPSSLARPNVPGVSLVEAWEG